MKTITILCDLCGESIPSLIDGTASTDPKNGPGVYAIQRAKEKSGVEISARLALHLLRTPAIGDIEEGDPDLCYDCQRELAEGLVGELERLHRSVLPLKPAACLPKKKR